MITYAAAFALQLVEASNLPMETARIVAVSDAVAAVEAWQQKAEAALQQAGVRLLTAAEVYGG